MFLPPQKTNQGALDNHCTWHTACLKDYNNNSTSPETPVIVATGFAAQCCCPWGVLDEVAELGGVVVLVGLGEVVDVIEVIELGELCQSTKLLSSKKKNPWLFIAKNTRFAVV